MLRQLEEFRDLNRFLIPMQFGVNIIRSYQWLKHNPLGLRENIFSSSMHSVGEFNATLCFCSFRLACLLVVYVQALNQREKCNRYKTLSEVGPSPLATQFLYLVAQRDRRAQ